jgi:hypothetical protein
MNEAVANLSRIPKVGLQPSIQFPGQLPPFHVQAGDLSGMMTDPRTIGGVAHNANIALAQAVGNALAGVENRYADKKARDVAFDVQRAQETLSNPTPENQNLYNQIMFKNGDPSQGLSKRGKEVQQALNFPIPGVQDKAPDHVKQARNIFQQMGGIFGRRQPQTIQQAQPQQAQAPMSETLGMPQGMTPTPGGGVQAPQPAATPGGTATQATAGAAPAGAQQATPTQQAAAGATPQQQAPWQPSGAYAAMRARFPQTYQLPPQQQAQLQAQAALVQAKIIPEAGQKLESYTKMMVEAAKDESRWSSVQAIVGERQAEAWYRMLTSGYAADQRLAGQQMMADARIKAAGAGYAASIYRSNVIQQLGNQKNMLQSQAQFLGTQQKSLTDQLKTDQDALTKGRNQGTLSSQQDTDLQNRVKWDQDRLNDLDWNLKQTRGMLGQVQNMITQSGTGETPLEGGAAEEQTPTTTAAPAQSPSDNLLNQVLPSYDENP